MTVQFTDQRDFFELYPLSSADIVDVAAAGNLSRQAIYGWVSGHSRMHRDTFMDLIVPTLRRRYPDIDPELVENVRQQCNDRALRRVRPYYPGPIPAPAPADPAPVADVLAALSSFQALSVMLRTAKLTPAQRLALIHILSEET